MYAIICVGAIYLDTILVVPHYPEEDKKLRATNLLVRRGGNCGNTLEVLEQLVYRESLQVADREDRTASEDLPLYLISVLPNKSSDAAASIQASFRHVKLDATCIYRQGSNTAASSYIIRSDETGSRTIVSYNGLEEMTTSEFEHRATLAVSQARDGQAWFHFEGRIPEVTLACIEYLRREPRFQNCKLSIELEKPEREGLREAAMEADVVFYSKIWAEYYGSGSAEEFLATQIDVARPGAILSCTWGAGGATMARKLEGGGEEWARVDGWKPKSKKAVVDAIGAGDTFIAGILYALTHRADEWTLEEKLKFANELAGRKVYRNGFSDVVADYFERSAEQS